MKKTNFTNSTLLKKLIHTSFVVQCFVKFKETQLDVMSDMTKIVDVSRQLKRFKAIASLLR